MTAIVSRRLATAETLVRSPLRVRIVGVVGFWVYSRCWSLSVLVAALPPRLAALPPLVR